MSAPNSEVTSQVTQRSNGNPDGVMLGQNSTDKISFYGVLPYSQRTNSAQSVGTTTATSSASFWGAASVNSTSWQATQYNSSAMTGGTAQATLAEICNTLVGLGIWKGA